MRPHDTIQLAFWGLAGITGVNGGCRILDIGWGLAELVDINGGSRNEYRVVGVGRY